MDKIKYMHANPLPGKRYLTFEQFNLITDIRNQWQQLTTWIMLLINCAVEQSENLETVAEKTYSKIPLDFYYTFQVFYGKTQAEFFLRLLSNHILIVWKLAEAVKNNEQDLVDKTTIDLYNNSDELALFLAEVNPFWAQTVWKQALDYYNAMIIEQIIAIVQKDYKKMVKIYDSMIDHAIILGDIMSRGIIASGVVFEDREPTE